MSSFHLSFPCRWFKPPAKIATGFRPRNDREKKGENRVSSLIVISSQVADASVQVADVTGQLGKGTE
jgi:hypothetical protein